MTQLKQASRNCITPLMKAIAAREYLTATLLCSLIKQGKAVIPHNNTRRIKKPCAIGHRLATKVNANLGTSTDKKDLKEELKKLQIAIEYGADTVMDLSVGGDIASMRRCIIEHSPVAVGTVPIYEISVLAKKNNKDILAFSHTDIMRILETQAKDGVDFFTIHAGVTRKSLSALQKQKRLLGIVSRGGAILANWIARHKKENPFYEHFNEILDLAYAYDITLSLGDGLRPGSILDATDKGQLAELRILGELAARAKRKNVQVMIEGPGHVPLNQIEKNILLEKKICHQAPFYVLGPLVTDIAAGYDHISGAIGGALAASLGADFLCYLTPSEHLRHPSVDDVREGVIASKIAAHAADIVKGCGKAVLKDKLMSEARRKRDWKAQISLSLDPKKASQYRASSKPDLFDVCTMCGDYCSIKMMEQCAKL